MTESLWKHLQYFFSTTKIILLKDQSMLWGQPLPHVFLVATASLVVSPVTLVTQSHRNQAARFNKVLSFSFCSSLKHKVTLLSWDNEMMCQQLNWNWEPCILKLVARSTAFNRSLASLLHLVVGIVRRWDWLRLTTSQWCHFAVTKLGNSSPLF